MGKRYCKSRNDKKSSTKKDGDSKRSENCVSNVCNSTFLTFSGTLSTPPSSSLSLTLNPAQQTILSQLNQNCVVRNLNVSFTPDINAFALDDSNNLIAFNTANPALFQTRPITGLIGDVTEFGLGIDFRPSNGQLYLVTKNGLGGTGNNTIGRIYILNTTGTGAVATFVSTLNQSLIVDEYSIDFNPVLDFLRIISHDGQDNYSVDVDTGNVDVQTDLSGTPTIGIVGIAYNNNLFGATSTQLFDINFARNFLVLQNPPASGVLTDIGPLGVDVDPDAGFDIQTNPTTGANIAFAVFIVNGVTGLYNVNLTTGAATLLGSFGAGDLEIIGLALPALPATSLLAVLNINGVASGVSAVVPNTTSQVNVSACLPITSTNNLSIMITEINGGFLPTSGSIAVTLEIVCNNGNKCHNPCDCVGFIGNNNINDVEFTFEKNFGYSKKGDKCRKR